MGWSFRSGFLAPLLCPERSRWAWGSESRHFFCFWHVTRHSLLLFVRSAVKRGAASSGPTEERKITMTIADWFLALLLVVISALAAAAQTPAKHDMTFADLIAMHRVSDLQISPDGKMVAYAVATPDLEANRNASNIWVVPVEGGASRQITRRGHDTRPRWSPDGMRIAFLSGRDGTPQVYTIMLAGGEASKITNLSTGADNELWSPDGKTIAFVSGVYPDCKDDECNRKRDEEKDKSKVKARIYERLLFRHWTQWSDGTR